MRLFSQADSIPTIRNLIYIEAGGAAGYYSINYERSICCCNYLTVAARIGLSSYHLRDYTARFNPDVLVPLTLNSYYGKNHKLELGAGGTIANVVYANKTDFKPRRIATFHSVLLMGYRYQKSSGGAFFRVAYTPIIEFNKHFRHWAGLSFGYAF